MPATWCAHLIEPLSCAYSLGPCVCVCVCGVNGLLQTKKKKNFSQEIQDGENVVFYENPKVCHFFRNERYENLIYCFSYSLRCCCPHAQKVESRKCNFSVNYGPGQKNRLFSTLFLLTNGNLHQCKYKDYNVHDDIFFLLAKVLL
jgi:hypothetical protein